MTATPFTKQNLVNDGMYIHHVAPDGTRTFVARFKGVQRRSLGPFMTFLRRNFTVEEYFAEREAGETPLRIARKKGFILSHIKTWMKREGYALTLEGYERWLADQTAKLDAR